MLTASSQRRIWSESPVVSRFTRRATSEPTRDHHHPPPDNHIMTTPFTSLSRASTIHSDDRTECPSFAVETPTPASRASSRAPSGIDLAAGEIRPISDSQSETLSVPRTLHITLP